MELHLGKMTTQDLAKWFNISYGSFRRRADELYEELKYYCDYEKKYGHIIVNRVKISTYDKGLNIKVENTYYNEIMQCINKQDGLSTLSGMARKYIDCPGINRNSLRKSRDLLFGSDKDIIKSKEFFYKTHGLIGEREYCWAIKLNDINSYRMLTPAEHELFSSLLGKHGTPEEMLKLKTLDKLFKEDQITKDEYFDLKENCGFFSTVLSSFKQLTGYQLVHCTKHELINNIKLSKEEQALLDTIKQG